MRLPGHLQIIDNSQSPLDLRPVVAAIMEAENWILERIPPDKKIVLIAGEVHNDYMHSFLWQALLKAHALQRAQNSDLSFALGYERPKNYTFEKSAMAGEKTFSPNTQGYKVERVRKYEDLRDLAAKENISMSSNDISVIPKPRLVKYKIFGKTVLNETVIMSYINQDDPFSKSIVEKYRPDLLGKEVLRSSPVPRILDPKKEFFERDGIELSNCAIVVNAIAHMQETNVRIYIQQCGQYHATGFRTAGSKAYAKSLSRKFQEAGCHVLPILPVENLRGFYGELNLDSRCRLDEFMMVTGNRALYDEFIDYDAAKQIASFGSKMNFA